MRAKIVQEKDKEDRAGREEQPEWWKEAKKGQKKL